MLFCSTTAQSCGSNKLGVNQLSQKPGARYRNSFPLFLQAEISF